MMCIFFILTIEKLNSFFFFEPLEGIHPEPFLNNMYTIGDIRYTTHSPELCEKLPTTTLYD